MPTPEVAFPPTPVGRRGARRPGSVVAALAWIPLAPFVDRTESPTRDLSPLQTGRTGLPLLRAGTGEVAITVPSGVAPIEKVTAWWSSGAGPHLLGGSIRRISGVFGPRIAEYERVDGRAWPHGRYEFHVLTPTPATALAFCLGSAGG